MILLLLPQNLTITTLQQILKKSGLFKSLKKDSCSIRSLKLNNLVVTDGIDKAEVLNSYFQSVSLYSRTRL